MGWNKILMGLFFLVVGGCAKVLKYPVVPKSTNDATLIGGLRYPYQFTYEGNPLSRMHGAADPDVHVWDGIVWVYCSQDRHMDSTIHAKRYDAMDGYHVFSSKDLVNWVDHGEIFHSSDVAWAWKYGGFLWAPGVARKNGKYYLYYPIRDKDKQWRVGVAVGKTPIGPFKDSGRPLEWLNHIDPKIFIDDDGQAYIYNNDGETDQRVPVVARLKPNMIELAEKPRKIVYASNEVMCNDTLRFLEGVFMHKRNGLYYFSYTNYFNPRNQGFYAVGKSPYGPFEWKGPMAAHPRGAQFHHSIVTFKGKDYCFYHIALDTLPRYKEGQGRIVCFDTLHYNSDGTIEMLQPTL